MIGCEVLMTLHPIIFYEAELLKRVIYTETTSKIKK